MKVKHLDGLPRRKVTVDELLETDQIVDILDDLYSKRHEIDQFLLVYTDRNSEIHEFWHGTRERLLFAVKSAEMRIMAPEAEVQE